MVCRDTEEGSFVFNASSISFPASLDDDVIIQGLVHNLLRRALSSSEALRSGAVVSLAAAQP